MAFAFSPFRRPKDRTQLKADAIYRKLSLQDRAVLAIGKFRRWILVNFYPEYVVASHARRQGGCARTGACCRLMVKCWALKKDAQGNPGCRVYSWRPKNCSTFPIDERDLRDRDLVMPDSPCGYWFLPKDGQGLGE